MAALKILEDWLQESDSMNALVQAQITTPGIAHSFLRDWMNALVQAKITTSGIAHSFLRDWMNALVEAKITTPGIAHTPSCVTG